MSQQHKPTNFRQAGYSTIAAIGMLIGIGVLFLTIFLLSTSGNKGIQTPADKQADNPAADAEQTDIATEPPFIRIPENSEIYANSTYKFMFAYPDSFGQLTDDGQSIGGNSIFRTESALAASKPIGNGTSFLDGRLGAYVYNRSDFELVINASELKVAPVKTGNDITWKVVSAGTSGKSSIGDAYPVKSTKSQTGITVFNFAIINDNKLLGRWVFEAGDNFVLITLPSISKPSGAALTAQDIAAYNIIGTNISKSVRLPANAVTGTTAPVLDTDESKADEEAITGTD